MFDLQIEERVLSELLAAPAPSLPHLPLRTRLPRYRLAPPSFRVALMTPAQEAALMGLVCACSSDACLRGNHQDHEPIDTALCPAGQAAEGAWRDSAGSTNR
jgi:hypothetical protein